jgi:hypothetical protein
LFPSANRSKQLIDDRLRSCREDPVIYYAAASGHNVPVVPREQTKTTIRITRMPIVTAPRCRFICRFVLCLCCAVAFNTIHLDNEATADEPLTTATLLSEMIDLVRLGRLP